MEIRILLLCENEKTAALDKRAMRDAGFPAHKVMTSGIAGARLLAGLEKREETPEIVVCGQKLEDMDGEQFCAIVREHPGLQTLPILLLMANEDEARRLETMGCGASIILGRPYSIDVLTKILRGLRDIARKRRQDPDDMEGGTKAFEVALSTYGILLRHERKPEDFFRAGMDYIKEKRWNFAISAFEMAMRDEQFKAEAEMGMAAAYKGKGDMLRFRTWLSRASETFVRGQRWRQARNSFARLLQQDPEAKNPFMTEAHRLIRLNDYAGAADALAHGADLIPKKQTGDRYARLCFAAGDPDAMRRALEEGLARENGAKASSLADEIRVHMENMAEERREREKLLAAERKWELARKMAAQKKQDAGQAVEQAPRPHAIQAEERIGRAYVAPKRERAPFAASLEEDQGMDASHADEIAADASTLMPLAEDEGASDLFSKKNRINDLLSVMKLTWKLARRSKDK